MAPCLGDRYARVSLLAPPNHIVGKQKEGRRATIKAHPATLSHPRPYGSSARTWIQIPISIHLNAAEVDAKAITIGAGNVELGVVSLIFPR